LAGPQSHAQTFLSKHFNALFWSGNEVAIWNAPYKTLCNKSLAFVMQQCDNLVYDAVHAMDSAGERVWAHQELIVLSEELKCCQEQFLSRPKAKIKFIPAEVMELSDITEILQQNWTLRGLYSLAHKFQHCSRWDIKNR
jgi:hypothetical protein